MGSPRARPERIASKTESARSTLPRSSAAATIALQSDASRDAFEPEPAPPPSDSATMSSARSASSAPETLLRRSAWSELSPGASDEPAPSPAAAELALCREGQREAGGKRREKLVLVADASGGGLRGRGGWWTAGAGGRKASAMAAWSQSENVEHMSRPFACG